MIIARVPKGVVIARSVSDAAIHAGDEWKKNFTTKITKTTKSSILSFPPPSGNPEGAGHKGLLKRKARKVTHSFSP
jgi:hypothetical protein